MPIRKVVFLLYVWQRLQCGCSISGVWHALGLGRGQGGAYILIVKQKLQLNAVLLRGTGLTLLPPVEATLHFFLRGAGMWGVVHTN